MRTGEVAGIAPIVDPALWSTVQTMRERRRTRAPGRIVKRDYALRLRCAGCGKYLYGDIGRYRHPPPTCETFLAATPWVRRQRRGNERDRDRRVQGHSYPQTWYEDAVGALLAEIGGLDDHTITEVVRLVAYLRSLPSLWADSGPEGRQALATALFASIEVEGYQRMSYELTPDAIALGLDAALPAALEVSAQIGEFGRGERVSASKTHVSVRPRPPIVLENITPTEWLDDYRTTG